MAAPTTWGVYDYWLGGNSHLRADRDLGKQIADRWPSVPVLVRASHDFHLRAGMWCAERGITRIIRVGTATYLPGRNFPAVAGRAHPGLRVVYVSRESDPHALAGELLTGPGITAVRADAEHPRSVLQSGPVAEMLADGKPVGLLLAMVAHFATPERAAANVAEYIPALPPGSAVIVSGMVTAERAAAREFRQMFTARRIYPWSVRDMRRMLDGLKLVPPGVVQVQAWPAGTQWAGAPLEGEIPVRVVGAVARRA